MNERKYIFDVAAHVAGAAASRAASGAASHEELVTALTLTVRCLRFGCSDDGDGALIVIRAAIRRLRRECADYEHALQTLQHRGVGLPSPTRDELFDEKDIVRRMKSDD